MGRIGHKRRRVLNQRRRGFLPSRQRRDRRRNGRGLAVSSSLSSSAPSDNPDRVRKSAT